MPELLSRPGVGTAIYPHDPGSAIPWLPHDLHPGGVAFSTLGIESLFAILTSSCYFTQQNRRFD